jgi:hypothetical protein
MAIQKAPAPATSFNIKTFFSDVLDQLGIPDNQGAVDFLVTWANYEKRAAGKPHGFNPLNTTKDMKSIDPLQTNFNTNAGYPVKSYSNYKTGVKATADTLKLPYYKNIVQALKNGKPAKLAYSTPGIARELKTWGTHSFAKNFVDYIAAAKKTAPQVKKEAKETGDNMTKIIVILVIVGGLLYTYTKIS